VKERPILFSAPMVLALLAGRKTQTRRIIQPAGVVKVDGGGRPFTDWWDKEEDHAWRRDVRCPYGVPGDRLWVREAWQTTASLDHMDAAGIVRAADEAGYKPWCPLHYNADGSRANWDVPAFGTAPGRQRRGRFMPRWASRIDLEITEVRVQRLQDITDADVLAEGIEQHANGQWLSKVGLCWPSPRAAYQALWEVINGVGAWATNPWVWTLSFKRLRPDADAAKAILARLRP
jgi:hypothetical protein